MVAVGVKCAIGSTKMFENCFTIFTLLNFLLASYIDFCSFSFSRAFFWAYNGSQLAPILFGYQHSSFVALHRKKVIKFWHDMRVNDIKF